MDLVEYFRWKSKIIIGMQFATSPYLLYTLFFASKLLLSPKQIFLPQTVLNHFLTHSLIYLFIHSFIQCIFTEHLLFVRFYVICSGEQDNVLSLLSWWLNLSHSSFSNFLRDKHFSLGVTIIYTLNKYLKSTS